MPKDYSNVIVLIALIYRTVGIDMGSCSIQTIIDYHKKIMEIGTEENENFKICSMPSVPKNYGYSYMDFCSNKASNSSKKSEFYHLNLKNLFSYDKTIEDLWLELCSKISNDLIVNSTDYRALEVLLGSQDNYIAIGKIKALAARGMEVKKESKVKPTVKVRTLKKSTPSPKK